MLGRGGRRPSAGVVGVGVVALENPREVLGDVLRVRVLEGILVPLLPELVDDEVEILLVPDLVVVAEVGEVRVVVGVVDGLLEGPREVLLEVVVAEDDGEGARGEQTRFLARRVLDEGLQKR